MRSRTEHKIANRFLTLIVIVLAVLGFSCTSAQEGDANEPDGPEAFVDRPMTAERLGELILSIDDQATLDGNSWFFKVLDLDVVMVYDIGADRMRIVIPIGKADDLEDGKLLRLMQANFDSALDARYAIARGLVWGAYIHPLSTLTDEEFLVGLGQTANVVLTFGSSYSSGLFMFNSGDSADIEQQKLIEELKKHKT